MAAKSGVFAALRPPYVGPQWVKWGEATYVKEHAPLPNSGNLSPLWRNEFCCLQRRVDGVRGRPDDTRCATRTRATGTHTAHARTARARRLQALEGGLAEYLPCSRKRAVIFFGWVLFLISLGSPHVRPMGVHCTCGEPSEIELTPITCGEPIHRGMAAL